MSKNTDNGDDDNNEDMATTVMRATTATTVTTLWMTTTTLNKDDAELWCKIHKHSLHEEDSCFQQRFTTTVLYKNRKKKLICLNFPSISTSLMIGQNWPKMWSNTLITKLQTKGQSTNWKNKKKKWKSWSEKQTVADQTLRILIAHNVFNKSIVLFLKSITFEGTQNSVVLAS